MQNAKREPSLDDYYMIKFLGSGSFSDVYKAVERDTGKIVAIKRCRAGSSKKYLKREKDALELLSGLKEFVQLHLSFHQSSKFHFVMTFAPNLDLFLFILLCPDYKRMQYLEQHAAECCRALEILHTKGLIHRDLKPENIVLDQEFHIKIADFGAAKMAVPDTVDPDGATEERRYASLVGTHEYMSPEVINRHEATRSSDLWALACIIYQMIDGDPPFTYGKDNLINRGDSEIYYSFEYDFPLNARDLVEKLLVMDPTQRLGANDQNGIYDSIRRHEFFEKIDWTKLREKQMPKLTPKEDPRPELKLPTKPEDMQSLMTEQAEKYLGHWFVDGELILYEGLVDLKFYLPTPTTKKITRNNNNNKKNSGMLLLTTGPRLFLILFFQHRPLHEIPWSPMLRAKVINTFNFEIYTPNCIYGFSSARNCFDWVKMLYEVRFGPNPD